MESKKKRIIVITVIAAVCIALAACLVIRGNQSKDPVYESFEIEVAEFNKRGNVILNTSFEALKEKNIEVADIITVNAGEQSFDIPVGTSYSDVDSGCMLCRFDLEDGKVVLAINGGSFAEAAGLAVKETIEEEPGYRWDVKINSVIVSLKDKGGYSDEYTIRSLERTNERADYSLLSDEDFANCREIAAAGIKENTLYRGTTPLDDDMARNTIAMAFLRDKGIATILNLSDSVEEMTEFETYTGSYYSSCKVFNAEMAYDFTSDIFKGKVKDCIVFMLQNDGPFYIHCKEGKDRTGVFCAVLEAYMGVSYDEIANDYMKTYVNFYHVEKDSDTYGVILKSNLVKTLSGMFEITDISAADLQKEAKEYLLSAGLTENELSDLTAKLAA